MEMERGLLKKQNFDEELGNFICYSTLAPTCEVESERGTGLRNQKTSVTQFIGRR